MAMRMPALFAHEPPREDPVWRAVLAAPHMPLPADIEAEALASYEEGERFLRSGRRGAGPEEIAALIEEMKAGQGDDDVGA